MTKRLIVFFLIIAGAASALRAQTSSSREYQIKAVFLFNFTKFVDWPTTALTDPKAPFIIGIAGDDPFGYYLAETVAGEYINGHPIEVQHYPEVKDYKNCQILYINSKSPEQTRAFLEVVSPQHTLTVSDANDFMRMGGIIRLYTESNKIKLQINIVAAKDEDISISSKLLRLAEIYNGSNH